MKTSKNKLEKLLENNINKDLYLNDFKLVISKLKCNKSIKYKVQSFFLIFVDNNDTENLVERAIKLLDNPKATKERYILQYGDVLGLEKYNIWISTLGQTLEKMQAKHGIKLGLEKWNNYCNLQSLTNTKEYKKEKFGMTDDEFHQYNLSRAVTLDNQIKKYGIEEGTKRFNAYCIKQRDVGCTEKYFIEKYGQIKGVAEYKRVNSEKGLTRENFIRKYGLVDGIVRHEQWMASNKLGGYSKSSQKVFWEIYDSLNDIDKNYCYFAELNKEFTQYSSIYNRVMAYDFVILNLKYCIEYNGDLFHANPELYCETDRPDFFNQHLTSKDIWLKDAEKIDNLEKQGYILDVVWESKCELELIKNRINDVRTIRQI